MELKNGIEEWNGMEWNGVGDWARAPMPFSPPLSSACQGGSNL